MGMNKLISFFHRCFTFNSYYSMSFEKVKNEARKYGITIDEYLINQVDEASFKLDLINELIRKDMANISKITLMISVIAFLISFITLIVVIIK